MDAIPLTSSTLTLRQTQGVKPLAERRELPPPSAGQVNEAEETRDAFNKFVGAVYFGQMTKAMRQTVGEAAYFHGGQAERVFQSQLDQQLADEMTQRGASPFAEGMFAKQFPHLADVLRRAETAAEQEAPGASLDQLTNLRRR